VRFRAVLLGIVLGDVALEPAIGLRLGLGFVEVIEGLVHFLDGAERAFDFASRAHGRAPAILAGREVGQHRHPEMFHDAAENSGLHDRAVIRIDRRRNALERRAVLFRLRRHDIEQKRSAASTSSP
jgi:hypothetical protein